MGFEEQAIHPYGDGCPGERLDERSIPPGGVPQARRLLDGMGGIKNHRHAEASHHREAGEVVDQTPVAEERAPLAEHDVLATACEQFRDGMLHVAGGDELPLLHIHRLPRGSCGEEEIGLTAEERRNLDQVTDCTDRSPLIGEMHVGGHREPRGGPHLVEDREPFVETGAAERPGAGAVGLVERRFEDAADRQACGDRGEGLRDLEAQALALHDAWPRDHQERLARTAPMRPDMSGETGDHRRLRQRRGRGKTPS